MSTEPIMERDFAVDQRRAAASVPRAAPPADQATRSWYARSAAVFRWLHIYLSMLSFAAFIFFAFTGLTLNHPTWFGAAEQIVRDHQGQLPAALLEGEVDKLAVAEQLRAEHVLRGAVAEFKVDELECLLIFKGPGYTADILVDRDDGTYMLTETTSSAVAVLNDLHKGRDTGAGWSWVIDISAVIMLLMGASGFGLLFYIKKRRVSGVVTAVVGTILLIIAWAACVR